MTELVLRHKLFRKLWAYRANWQDMGYIGDGMDVTLSREEMEWVMCRAARPEEEK